MDDPKAWVEQLCGMTVACVNCKQPVRVTALNAVRCEDCTYEAAPDMICERHPWLGWPHNDCAGPGCPPTAAMTLMKRRERSLQIGMQSRDTNIVDLRRRVLELESGEISDLEVERAAKAICHTAFSVGGYDDLPHAAQEPYRKMARAALAAARGGEATSSPRRLIGQHEGGGSDG